MTTRFFSRLKNQTRLFAAAALMALTLTGTAVAQRNDNGGNRGWRNQSEQRRDNGQRDSRNWRPNNYRWGGSGGFSFRFDGPRRNYYPYYGPRYSAPPCGYYDRRGFWHRDPGCYYGYYGPY